MEMELKQKIDWGNDFLDKINSILIPYFRGFYYESADATKQLAKRDDLPDYERRLFANFGKYVIEHKPNKCYENMGKLLEEMNRDYSNYMMDTYKCYAHYARCWSLTSSRRASSLQATIREGEQALQIYNANSARLELLPGIWLINDMIGWAYYNMGRTRKSITEANLAVRLLNEWLEFMQNNGRLRKDNIYSREYVMEKALSIARTIATRAMYFFELGDFNSALVDLHTAMEIDPDNPYCKSWTGLILCQQDDYSKGLDVLRKACHKLDIEQARTKNAELTGRPRYILAIYDYDYKARMSLLGEPFSATDRDVSAQLFYDAFKAFCDTYRIHDAIESAILSLDILNCKHKNLYSKAAAQLLWKLITGIDGVDTYLGKVYKHHVMTMSYLTKE